MAESHIHAGERRTASGSSSDLPRHLAVAQRALLLAGIVLLGVSSLLTLDGLAHNRLEIERFRRLRTQRAAAHRAAPPYRSLAGATGSTVAGPPLATAVPDGSPIGTLRIPRLDLEVAILEGTGHATLRRGAGHVAGTAFPGQDGNTGIAAHRDSFFRDLRKLRVGDRIEIDTLDRTLIYRADSVSIVDPDSVEVLQASPGRDLTLVTCYPFYYLGFAPSRYIVHGHLVESGAAESLPELIDWRRTALSRGR